MPAIERRSLLLLEPDFVMRRTVASVAKALGLADVHEAASMDTGAMMLRCQAFDMVFIAIDAGDGVREQALLHDLRAGATECAADTRVAVMTSPPCSADLIIALRNLDVSRVILKPFKVKTVIETMSQVFARTAAVSTAPA